ncbi:MAG: TIGR04255 family protein [Bacteroidaceae bacterium]|nr:TIGR04255 family protein [Bacteroidaceae bacterium]
MTRLRIFVGGVHGAGKGSLCKQLVNHFIGEYVSASQLLHWNSKYKYVKDVSYNQDLLTELLQKYTQHDTNYVIDGHFALWNSDYKCEVVPIKTFESLNLSMIIIVKCANELIQKRLKFRDDVSYRLDDIKVLQSLEEEQAKIVAESLGIPLMIVNPTECFDYFNFIKHIEMMKQYTRDNISSQMLKTAIIRIDFTGLTNVRSFVNRIKSSVKLQEAFGKMVMIPKQNMSVSFRPKDIEEGQLPFTETQKSILFRFHECKMEGDSNVTLDIEPESITLAIDCQKNYKGSRDYSYFMGWIIDELLAFDQYVTIIRLGVRKIDVQVLEAGEPIEKYFNERFVVTQSWKSWPPKTKSILTELLEIDNISFNVTQYIDRINDGRERLIYDVDAFLNGNILEKALKSGNASDFLYHDMQDRMFDFFVSVASIDYLELSKKRKTEQNGQ